MTLAMSAGTWIGAFIFLVIWIALAFWPARVAGRKGHSFVGYFILSPVSYTHLTLPTILRV